MLDLVEGGNYGSDVGVTVTTAVAKTNTDKQKAVAASYKHRIMAAHNTQAVLHLHRTTDNLDADMLRNLRKLEHMKENMKATI